MKVRLRDVLLLAVTSFSVGGLLACQTITAAEDDSPVIQADAAVPSAPAPQVGADSQPVVIADGDMREFLAELAEAHDDKVKLSFWVSTPFKSVDDPFKPFFNNMGKRNKELLAELQGWAKKNHMDLTVHPRNDLDGKAEQILDAKTEKIIRGDGKVDFERDILISMHQDYEWRLAQLQVAVSHAKDAELKAYLKKCMDMYSKGTEEIDGLLKHFKYVP